jgi:hypothetical protein
MASAARAATCSSFAEVGNERDRGRLKQSSNPSPTGSKGSEPTDCRFVAANKVVSSSFESPMLRSSKDKRRVVTSRYDDADRSNEW